MKHSRDLQPAKRRGRAIRLFGLTFVCIAALHTRIVQAQDEYRIPPKPVLDVLNAPPTPRASISPSRDIVLLYSPELYAPLSVISRPFLGLGGLRIDVATNGPHNPPRFDKLVLKRVADGSEKMVILPPRFFVSQPFWAPDGQHFAFTHSTASATELWIADAHSGVAHVIKSAKLNAALGAPCKWMPGSESLLCRVIPAARRPLPEVSMVPTNPRIEMSEGKTTAVPTYEDLLKDAHDGDLFDYFATSQISIVDIAHNRMTLIGPPAIFHSVDSSPDSKYILVEKIHRPYSYVVRENDFPRQIEVWDHTGRVIYDLASLPLEDAVPIGGVPPGPRNVQWLPSDPATLVWAEALDGGDPKQNVTERDKVIWLNAPFKNVPVELVRTQHRFAGLYWGQEGHLAILLESDRKEVRWRAWFFDPAKASEKRLGWDLSIQDRYHQPGEPLMGMLPSGYDAISQRDNFIYFAGPGFSPEGARPFLDRFDVRTLQPSRIFQSDQKNYETVVGLLATDGSSFLTRRESPTDVPNYYIHAANGLVTQFTRFPDRTPQLRAINKKIVTYKRADGVGLSMTIYLPPDYKPGEKRPAVLWAYPMEFTDANVASQVIDSPNRFTTITSVSELFFLLDGYVVLDGVSMPIVGNPETANDTFVEQIAASAKAAIDKATEMGVIDANKVGVGGASYGAFMTANLLAHTDLFRAGVALSGAYDRTLTPFGFQHERRTLWQARETYVNISPLMYADRIKAPLLLIHGAADDNPGTFPIQSEMMYRAIQGNGGIVRYVLLPGEGHAYLAQESVADALSEMMAWFDKHVKQAATESSTNVSPCD